MKRRRGWVLAIALLAAGSACSFFGFFGGDTTTPPSPTEPPPAGAMLDENGNAVTPELPPPDFVDLILERIESGELNRQEGILNGLRLMAGESTVGELFGDTDVQLNSGWGMTLLGAELYRSTEDPAVRAELVRLMAKVAPQQANLDPYAAPEEEASRAGGPLAARPLRQPEVDCRSVWDLGFPTRIDGTPPICLLLRTFTVGGSTIRIYYPVERRSDAGMMSYVDNAEEALRHSHDVIDALTPLEDINLIFTETGPAGAISTGPYAAIPSVDASFGGRDFACPIMVFPNALGLPADYFKQAIAHETFHCAHYWRKSIAGYEGTAWYTEGMATYFSNVVYPSVNMEQVDFQQPFDITSMYTSIVDMTYQGFVFFQYLGNRFGNDYLIHLLDELPDEGSSSTMRSALASQPDMEDIFHDFGEAYLSKKINDSGGGPLPIHVYIPIDADFTIGEGTELSFEADPFVIDRARVTFDQCGQFDLFKTPTGGDGQSTWKDREASAFSEIPDNVNVNCDQSQYRLLLTSTRSQTGLDFRANLAEDGRCDCCLNGMWEQDTDEVASHLRAALSAGPASLESIDGRFLLSITSHGTMTIWPESFSGVVRLDEDAVAFDMVGSSTSTFVIPEEHVIRADQGEAGFLIHMETGEGGGTIPIDAGALGGPLASGGEFRYTCTDTRLTVQIPSGAAPFSSSAFHRLSEPPRTPTPEPLEEPGSAELPPSDLVGPTAVCERLSIRGFETDGSTARWTLANDSTESVEISALSLNWPAANGELMSVQLGGETIWEGTASGMMRITDGWSGDAAARQLPAGRSAPIELTFNSAPLGSTGYIHAIEFSNACTVADVR